MAKCKHQLIYLEVIAGEQTAWFEDGKLNTSLNAGNRIRHEVFCVDCRKSWSINRNSPKFIKKFYNKIDEALGDH